MHRFTANLFKRYIKPLKKDADLISVEEDDNLIIVIDNSWSNDYAIGIQGWIISKKGSIDEVEIEVNGTTVPITAWYPRPDVSAAYPQYNLNDNCGFWVNIPRLAEHLVTFKAKNQRITWTKSLAFKGSKPQPPVDFPEGMGIFADFVKLVNDNHLSVLEIGSRIVSPGSSSKRALFPGASSYTGFDYYPDSNTDVVGDTHRLSQYFGDQLFDAIFSLAVFEHLAMPWVVAMEINKLLKVGGITCHNTVNAWPVHERPWDFWRFSDEGLKVLFSPPMGFETIRAGFFEPLRMHLDNLQHSHYGFEQMPSFGGVAILAKKTADVNSAQFKWDVALEDVLDSTSHYPKPIHIDGLDMNILDKYVTSAPSPQNALDIFKGEWSSKLPEPFAVLQAGSAQLFEDPRMDWCDAQFGGFEGKTVIELGPLEAGHTYMIERLGAAEIVSIEANTRAYLKCLIVKELLELKHTRFLCGDFVEYLRTNQKKFDVCIASGVLYHMNNPVELLALAAKASDQLFIWTHYYDQAIISGDPKLAYRLSSGTPAEYGGFRHTLYRQEYKAALNWGGFCGGSDESTNWLSREDILACLKHFGLNNIQINFDHPDHPNGPSFALTAVR